MDAQTKQKNERQKFIFMGGLLSILFLLFIFVNDPFGLFEKGLGTGKKVFPSLKPELASKIFLREAEGATVLVREGGTWKVIGKKLTNLDKEKTEKAAGEDSEVIDNMIFYPVDRDPSKLKRFNANQKLVEDMLKIVSALDEKKEISNQVKKWDIFKVGREFELAFQSFDASGNEVASVVIGKNGSDFSSQYFRKKGETKVLSAPKSIIYQFRRSIRDWRDKTIMALSSNDIHSFGYTKGGAKYEMKKIEVEELVKKPKGKKDEKDKGGKEPKKQTKKVIKWQIITPQKAFAQKGKADGMIRVFSSLKARDFVNDDSKTAKRPQKSLGRIWAKSKAGTVYNIDIFGQRDKKDKNVLVRKEGHKQIYLISKSDYDRLTLAFKDIVEKKSF